MTESRNLLSEETSPYLRQHADNPVHWHPWNDAALARAKQEQKPILLSVGYAACHWCHVMAHESFEDDAIAALMNEHFINIKVDREERPDLDAIYQHALALLGEHGGWPLTMFLTPDGEPFWGGTYFPPTPRFGRPGFPAVLDRIAEIYRDEHDKVRQNVTALVAALKDHSTARTGGPISMDVTDQVAERFLSDLDRVHGGVGGAPKFPQPPIFELLWRAWKRTGNLSFRDAVTLTLDRMCQGGIYDHLGGGFARYATDSAWLVPHFEKMLYDNAQLIELLTLVWQDLRTPLYELRVRETIDWLLREMRLEGGGFAGTLDADSEGEEGKFYVWTEAEIDALLGDQSAPFKAVYDVTAAGNWEGKVILNRSANTALGTATSEAALSRSRAILLEARGGRIRPGLDDKVLADWNGLIIAALAKAGTVFAIPEAVDAAKAAFAFVVDAMTDVENGEPRLRHSWCRNRPQHPATLDDYANMTRAALALHAATGDDAYLAQAEQWLETVDRHYADPESGGYFLSANDVTDVIARTRTVADNAVPAGNAILANNLAQLFYLTGRDDYRARAEALISAFSGELQRNIFPLSTLLNANERFMQAVQTVVIGDRGGAETEALIDAINGVSVPDLVLQVVADGSALPSAHPAHGKDRTDGNATVYICRGTTCSLPLSDAEAVRAALGGA